MAVAATQARTQLLQEIGFLDRKIGTLLIDDGKRVDRIPSGQELQKLYDSINVTNEDLLSEAEIAWNYGDAAKAEAAAKEAP